MNQSFRVKKTRSVGDVLTDTFMYIREYYKTLGKMIAVYVLAPLMAGSLILAVTVGDTMGSILSNVQGQSAPNLDSFGIALVGGFLILMLSYVLLSGVIYQHIYYAGRGDVPEDISVFSDGLFSKLGRFILVMLVFGFVAFMFVFALVYSIIEISGFLTILIIPGLIYLFIKLILFPIAFFIEDAGGFNSLARSWELTNGYFWPTVGVYLLISIVFGILSQLLSTPLLFVTAIAGSGFGVDSTVMKLFAGGTYLISFIFQMFFFAAQSISLGLHYYNLEERKEGHVLSQQVADLEKSISQ